MRKKMAVKRKMRLKTTVTMMNKQKMKDKQNYNDRDWASGLADHLLELVIERLPLVDCFSFIGVCKPWRNTTAKLFKESSHVIPLLVKPWQSENITRTCLNVLDKTNEYSTVDLPIPEEYIGSHIWGSYRNWLFLGKLFKYRLKKYVRITLLNPFSGEKVVLPNTRDDYHMVVLSSAPSDPKCIYMLVGHDLGVAFWTSGASRVWRKCDTLVGSERVVDALYHKGHFYLLKEAYEMVIIDQISVVNMLNNNNMVEDNGSSIATRYLPLKMPCSENARKYIVESNGDILLVCRIFYEDDSPLEEKTQGFETYKLDISQMAWVKLERLGNNNQVLFLGKSCSRSFNTKEIVEGGDDALANKIFFSNNSYTNRTNEWDDVLKCFKERSDAEDWGVFSLNKENSDWPRAFRENAKHCAGIWVMAPIWWCFWQMLLKRVD